jgi:hypothetical protein
MRNFLQFLGIDGQGNCESGRGQVVISATIVPLTNAAVRRVFGPTHNRNRRLSFCTQKGTEKNDDRYRSCEAHIGSIEESPAGRGGQAGLPKRLLIKGFVATMEKLCSVKSITDEQPSTRIDSLKWRLSPCFVFSWPELICDFFLFGCRLMSC